ncbi:MAG: baseplate J/gp47 family protein [Firmicutes bacterium]|nr:baseplate J/gp47 family protein [Bacillota bacterium]
MRVGEITRIVVGPDDQVNHLVRKINAAKGEIVVLEVPVSTRVTDSGANLRLLKFYAERAGKELYLATDLPEVLARAAEHGVQIYTPEKALETVRRSETRRAQRQFRPRWYHLLGLPLLIVAIAVYTLYAPEPVKVVLIPTVRPYQGSFQVPLSELKLETIEAQFTLGHQLAASGRATQGVAHAKGRVIFFNDSADPVQVPAGTVVATAGDVRYQTTASVRVPGRQPEFFHDIPVGVRAGQAEVGVRAVEPGTEGNVATGRITKVPAFPELKVVNPEPVTGGAERTLTVVTEEDLAALKDQLARLAAEQAEAELKLAAGEGRELLLATLDREFSQIQLTPKPGEQAGTAQGKAMVRASCQGVDRKELSSYLTQLVLDELDKIGETLATPVELVSLRLEPEGRLFCQVEAIARPVLFPVKLAKMVTGLPLDEASAALAALENISSVEIEAGERKRMPLFYQFIQVEITSPTEEAVSGGV